MDDLLAFRGYNRPIQSQITETLLSMRHALLTWYQTHSRDLPWRKTRDPYAILVSEIMLQQTQVVRVVQRYETWLQTWPTVEHLAAAARADVLRAWVGLGYNRRAIQLHQAAEIIVQEGWPTSAKTLQKLPGIGPYTAAAVAAFAFDEQIAAVDTNVRRLTTRLRVSPDEFLLIGEAATFNQATIELGALVCTARKPLCHSCPLSTWCPSAGNPDLTKPLSRSRKQPRFEETDRFVRGRIIAALAEEKPLPKQIDPERLQRAIRSLERDGLIVCDGETISLP